MKILEKVVGLMKMAKKKWSEYSYKQKVGSFNNLVNRLKREGMTSQQIIERVSNVDGFVPRDSGRITEKMKIDEKAIEAAFNSLPTVKEAREEIAERDKRLAAEAHEAARVARVKQALDEEAEEIWDWYNSPEGALASTTNKEVHALLRDLGYKYRYGNVEDAKSFFDYGMDQLIKSGHIKSKVGE